MAVLEGKSRRGGMADALDSKSSDRKIVWVQVPPPAEFSRVGGDFTRVSRGRILGA